MPASRVACSEEFGFDAQLADPDLAVAKGAALYGQKKQLERTVQEATDRGVDLTKAVAAVAAEHGMTSDEVSRSSSRDRQCFSRGFGLSRCATTFDTACFLVHRNDPVRVSVEERFYTVSDDQDILRVRVFEQGGCGGVVAARGQDGPRRGRDHGACRRSEPRGDRDYDAD